MVENWDADFLAPKSADFRGIPKSVHFKIFFVIWILKKKSNPLLPAGTPMNHRHFSIVNHSHYYCAVQKEIPQIKKIYLGTLNDKACDSQSVSYTHLTLPTILLV